MILFDIETTHLLFVGVINLQTYFYASKILWIYFFLWFFLAGLTWCVRHSVFNAFGSHKIQITTAWTKCCITHRLIVGVRITVWKLVSSVYAQHRFTLNFSPLTCSSFNWLLQCSNNVFWNMYNVIMLYRWQISHEAFRSWFVKRAYTDILSSRNI